MGERSKAKRRGQSGGLPLVLVLAGSCFVPTHGAAEDQEQAHEAPARQVPRHHNHSGLEERVKAFSKALDLDARQQAELKKVLESQREQIRRVWSDGSVPPDQRASATRAISYQTADRIRALLNEEQRKKYSPPRPPQEAAGSARSVEDGMNVAKPK